MIDGNKIFTEFKGTMAEQLVMQELTCTNPDYLGYWTNERSTSEVDFVLQKEGSIVPIEVKSGENLGSCSFTLFCDKYSVNLYSSYLAGVFLISSVASIFLNFFIQP